MKLRGEKYFRDKTIRRFQEIKWFWAEPTVLLYPAVSNLLGPRDLFHGRQFIPGLGKGQRRFKCITLTVHFISIIIIISAPPQIIRH